MNKFEVKSEFKEYESLEELQKAEKRLVESAMESSHKAYAPYSEFKVGAAVLLSNDQIILGNNQENAAYPSGLCAERIAVFYANATYPDIPVTKLAITAIRKGKIVQEPITPCGSCLQVLLETQERYNQNIEILLYGSERILKADNVEQFLPMNFNLRSLKG